MELPNYKLTEGSWDPKLHQWSFLWNRTGSAAPDGVGPVSINWLMVFHISTFQTVAVNILYSEVLFSPLMTRTWINHSNLIFWSFILPTHDNLNMWSYGPRELQPLNLEPSSASQFTRAKRWKNAVVEPRFSKASSFWARETMNFQVQRFHPRKCEWSWLVNGNNFVNNDHHQKAGYDYNGTLPAHEQALLGEHETMINRLATTGGYVYQQWTMINTDHRQWAMNGRHEAMINHNRVLGDPQLGDKPTIDNDKQVERLSIPLGINNHR